MALPLPLCETFLKRSCRRAATVLTALIALSGVPVDDADARQAAPAGEPAAHASAPAAQSPAATPAHAAPAADEKVEAAQPSADPAHAAPHQPAPAGAPAGGPAAPPAHEPAADAAHGQPQAHGPPAGGEHGAGGGAHETQSIWQTIGPYFNFLVLAGGLFYFLRAPLTQYLASRDQQIRGGLVSARETSEHASAQLAEIDRRLAALPAEIDALRARGVAEIAAEESRIQADAEAERKRLLDDMQRDVDMRVRVAKKMLTERAADLAVTLAAQRVKDTITDADQQRLVDRYAAQVKDIHG